MGEPISFDPALLRLDLTPEAAFALTRVISPKDFEEISGSLDDLRGLSYVFINLIDGIARLLLTVITASQKEVTATFALDIKSLGIEASDLLEAITANGGSVNRSGTYPITPRISKILREAIYQAEAGGDWRFFKDKDNAGCRLDVKK